MIQNPEDELKMQNREEFTQPPVEVKIALYKKYLIIDVPITSPGTEEAKNTKNSTFDNQNASS